MNARIVWGWPTNKTIAVYSDQAVEVTEENLAGLKENFPDLIAKLRREIGDRPEGR